MNPVQIQLNDDTKMIEVLSKIAQSKEPIEIDFKFQGITFKVESKLININGGKAHLKT